MLIKAVKDITAISDRQEVNLQNYFEVLNYIDGLYNFINKIKLVVPTDDLIFLPTFKGEMTCQIFGFTGTEKENQLKVFKVKSAKFLEDKESVEEKISDVLGSDCEKIVYDGDLITFVLK